VSANWLLSSSVEIFSCNLFISSTMDDSEGSGGFLPSRAMAGKQRETRGKRNSGMTSKYLVM
jgi:hypothetical protein